jgi:hypothetical protein
VVSQLGKYMGTLSSHITSMRCDMASLKLEYATMSGNLASLLEKSQTVEAIHTPTVNDASPKGHPNASTPPKSQSSPSRVQASPSTPFAVTNQSASAILMDQAVMSHAASWQHPTTTARLLAHDFYFHVCAEGAVPSTLTGGHRTRAEKCMTFFNAMATKEEREEMRNTSTGSIGSRRVLAEKLSKLVLGRVIDGFLEVKKRDSSYKIPPKLKKAGKDLLVGAVEERALELKKLQINIIPDSSQFQIWRAANEEKYAPNVTTPPSKRRRLSAQ